MNVRNNNRGFRTRDMFCSLVKQHRDEVRGEESSGYQIVQLRLERNWETAS